MSTPNITRWIGIGLLGLPLYGVLTFFSSIDPQPDPNTHYEAWSRFVTTDGYVLKHLFLTILGMIFGIFGSIALGAYLTRSRAGGMGLWAMVLTVLGYSLFLTWGGVSTFAAPIEGQAYLAGIEAYKELPTSLAGTLQGATMAASIVLGFAGNVLLGVAVWNPAEVVGSALGVRAGVDVHLRSGVRDDDRRPSHPAYRTRWRSTSGDRRSVDGLQRPAPTLHRRGERRGPT